MKRLFLAFDLSDETRQCLASAVSWMLDYEGRVRVVPAKNYHVTLRFLGSTPEEKLGQIQQVLEREAKTIKPCEIHLSEWGVFPDKEPPNIFWIGVEPENNLREIFMRCERALESVGFIKETRGFRAHITLARTGKNNLPLKFHKGWKSLE